MAEWLLANPYILFLVFFGPFARIRWTKKGGFELDLGWGRSPNEALSTALRALGAGLKKRA